MLWHGKISDWTRTNIVQFVPTDITLLNPYLMYFDEGIISSIERKCPENPYTIADARKESMRKQKADIEAQESLPFRAESVSSKSSACFAHTPPSSGQGSL